jgi:hypothetical protein
MKILKVISGVLFSIIFCFNANAQNFSFTYDTDSIEIGQPGSTQIVYATITNLSSSPLTLDIFRAENNIPSGWLTSICVDVCLPPNVSSTTLYLPGLSTQSFLMHFFTDTIPAIGQTKIEITNQADTTEDVGLKFYCQTSATAGLQPEGETRFNLSIYPNPASTHITIDYGNFSIMNGYQLVIENSLGQQVFQTTINQQSDYLSLATWGGNGLYFVHIIDTQGNTIDIRKIVLQ